MSVVPLLHIFLCALILMNILERTIDTFYRVSYLDIHVYNSTALQYLHVLLLVKFYQLLLIPGMHTKKSPLPKGVS